MLNKINTSSSSWVKKENKRDKFLANLIFKRERRIEGERERREQRKREKEKLKKKIKITG